MTAITNINAISNVCFAKCIIDSYKEFCKINYFNKSYYLPNELIMKIYEIVIQNYYANIINKNLKNYIRIKRCILIILFYSLDRRENIIEAANITALQFLVNSNITRKYDLNFWAYLLQSLSTKINRLRFRFRYDDIGNKSINGKKLLLVLDLWLQLCKKFNLKIYLETKNSEKYIRAQNILKMNNYDKYIFTPMIIKPFSNNIWVNYDEAIVYLQTKLIAFTNFKKK